MLKIVYNFLKFIFKIIFAIKNDLTFSYDKFYSFQHISSYLDRKSYIINGPNYLFWAINKNIILNNTFQTITLINKRQKTKPGYS